MCQKHTSALWPQCTHFHTPLTVQLSSPAMCKGRLQSQLCE